MTTPLGPDWVDRTGDPAYQLQTIDQACKPVAGWEGLPDRAAVSSYARTMLFNDHRVSGVLKTPGADDIGVLHLRSSVDYQVALCAYNNFYWVIGTSAGGYNLIPGNTVAQAVSHAPLVMVDQDEVAFEARGNVYIGYLNGVEVVRWTDQAGVYAPYVNADHHEVAIGYLWGNQTTGGWDSWRADDLYIWPSPVGTTGNGTLSATVEKAAVPPTPVAVAFTGGGALAATAAFPPMTPATQQFTTPGPYAYTIPYQCTYIDVICLGAGGGGRGMPLAAGWGEGGGGGLWSSTTLTRGVDIPWDTAQITGDVGAGGFAGDENGGGPGGTSTATATGWAAPINAAGGTGAPGQVEAASKAIDGMSPGDHVCQGITYPGGGVQTSPSTNGLPPGGGGSAATISNRDGGAGAAGSVWIRAW